MSIYDRFGVRTIINAKGPSTRLSGGFLDPEVSAAMTEAATYCVDMAELQAHADTFVQHLGSYPGWPELAGLDDCIDCEVPESARPTDAAEAAMAESA